MRNIVLFWLLTSLVCSCGYEKINENGNRKVRKHPSLLYDDKDSLNTTFFRKEFQPTLDSIRLSEDGNLNKISLIEYYGSPGYAPANINCILLQYDTKGVICLLRYYGLENGWKIQKRVELPLDRLIAIDNSIIKNPYWTDSKSAQETYESGDFVRYSTIDHASKTMTKAIKDPNIKLYRMLTDMLPPKTGNK